MMENRELHISRLIDRFYRGETSPGEEREIVRFFRSEEGSLPADLERERAFFLALADASSAMPDDVAVRIEKALDDMAARDTDGGEASSRTTAFGWRRFLSAAACVAVIALGALLSINYGDKATTLHGPSETPVARAVQPEASASDENDSSASASAPAVDEHIIPEQRIAEVRPSKTPKRIRPKAAVKPKAETVETAISVSAVTDEVSDENLRIVTDPEEARDLMAQVLAMLDSRMEAGMNACQTADGIISTNIEKAKYTIYGKI